MSITAINTRNQLKGRIVSIHRGDIVSEVEIETAAGILSAVVTSSSIQRLGLRVGDTTAALFKATEVLLAKLDA